MIKLYARDDAGVLCYHEAWVDGDEIVEHWGRVGERGADRKHPVPRGSRPAALLEAVLADARGRGFAEIDEDDLVYLEIEYELDSWGTGADLDVRNEIGALLDEALGWTGLGHWDGGSIGSGTMEVGCLVVDFEIAQRVIEEALTDPKYPKFSRISEL
jgi:hypothetical protein